MHIFTKKLKKAEKLFVAHFGHFPEYPQEFGFDQSAYAEELIKSIEDDFDYIIEKYGVKSIEDEISEKSIDNDKDDILFEYERTPSFGAVGSDGGNSFIVKKDGEIIRRHFIFRQNGVASEEKIAHISEVATLINNTIIAHKSVLEKIPDKLNNGSLDGSQDCFRFGQKRISSWNIKRTDLLEVEQINPPYYQKYKDNMIYENQVLDIYNEIVDILDEFKLDVKLRKM